MSTKRGGHRCGAYFVVVNRGVALSGGEAGVAEQVCTEPAGSGCRGGRGWRSDASTFVAVAVPLLSWLVVALVTYGLYRGGRRLWLNHRARVLQNEHQMAELLARAEIQQRWHLAGDPRGTYGRYPPAGVLR